MFLGVVVHAKFSNNLLLTSTKRPTFGRNETNDPKTKTLVMVWFQEKNLQKY